MSRRLGILNSSHISQSCLYLTVVGKTRPRWVRSSGHNHVVGSPQDAQFGVKSNDTASMLFARIP